MPSTITQLIQTKYDGSGISQFKNGMEGVEKSVVAAESNAGRFGDNFEGLSKKMERPLGRVAFHSLAQDLLNSQAGLGKLDGASRALSGGIDALGNAALFAGGQFAVMAVAAIAVYDIYSKLHTSSSNLAAKTKEATGALAEEVNASKDAITVMKERNLLTEKQTKIADDLTKSYKQKIKDIRDDIELQITLNKQTQESIAREIERFGTLGTQGKLNKAKEEENNLIKAKLALAPALKSMDEYDNKKKGDTSALNEVNQIFEKRNIMMMSTITILESLQVQEGQLAEAEKRFIATTDPIKKKSIAEDIIGLNRKMTAEREALKNIQAIHKAEEDALKRRANTYDKYLSMVSDSVEVHGKKVVFNGRKFLAEELKDVANQAAYYLEIQAAKYFASGNYVMGAAALAGAAAVKVAAAAGAGLLEAQAGGDTNTPSTSESGRGITETSTLGSAQESNLRPMNINIQVNALHAGTADQLGVKLIELLNKAQDVAGAQLKATTIQTGGAWIPA